MGRAEERAADLGQRVDRLGADLRRPGAEPPVTRKEIGRDADVRRGRRTHEGTLRVAGGERVATSVATKTPCPLDLGSLGPCAILAGVDRISRRIGAIAESATLAVDAQAKALKAAGEDVIGFGAGEP